MLHQVSINGSALSTLLQSLISLGRNVDGLLLGHVQTHVHTQFKDDDSGAPRRPCLADAHVMHSCTHTGTSACQCARMAIGRALW